MVEKSILFIKPEAIVLPDEVERSVKRRGYEVVVKERRQGWRQAMREIYTQFPSEQIEANIKAYDLRGFRDDYMVLVLDHPYGDALSRLKRDEGHFKRYQIFNDRSLRAEFGLPSAWNVPYNDQVTFVFCALHCPGTKEELKHHINVLGLEKHFTD